MSLSIKRSFIFFICLLSLALVNISNAAFWPEGNNDVVSVPKNGSIVINVLKNDTGSNLKITQIDSWTANGGFSTINASKTNITFKPATNFVGQDSFWYDFVDDQGRDNAAKVIITVTQKSTPPPTNNAWPTGTFDTASTKKNTSTNISVLANDIGQNLRITEIDSWTQKAGQAIINSNNTVTYTPASNFTGKDTFWYSFADDQGRDNAAEVTVTVTSGSTPTDIYPIAKTDNATTSINHPTNISVLANDIGINLKLIDVDGWTLHGGRVTIDASKTLVRYTPATGFLGNDSFWYGFKDKLNRKEYAEVKVTVTSNNSVQFSHVKMHYDLLANQPMIWGEAGSAPSTPNQETITKINLTQSARAASTELKVQSHRGLLVNQLLVYLGSDGKYYAAQINNFPNQQTIRLKKPLQANISSGQKVWNFYANPSHPNRYGYRAIADFAVSSLQMGSNTPGKHVLFGDSWFQNDDKGYSTARFSANLPGSNVVNKGYGGNTTQDLLNRFDTDVAPLAPDYVWIISGTNDYWNGISKAQFKANMKTLIIKSNALGAKVIVIDSSAGFGTGPKGKSNLQQSKEYVDALKELKNKTSNGRNSL